MITMYRSMIFVALMGLILINLTPVSADEVIIKDKYTMSIPSVSDQPYYFESTDENILWTFKGMSTRGADFNALVNYKNDKSVLDGDVHNNILQGINATMTYSVTKNSFNKVLILNKNDLPTEYTYLTLNDVYTTEKDSSNSYIPVGSNEKVMWTDKETVKEITASKLYFGDNGLIFRSPIAWDDNGTLIKGFYEVKYNSPTSIELYTTFSKEDIDTLDNKIYLDPNVGFWYSDSSVVSGISNINFASAPCVFDFIGIRQMISGGYDGILYGYDWNGTGWDVNNTLVQNVVDVGTYSVPTVYNDGGTLKLIVGASDGGIDGYTGGGPWASDGNVVNGITTMVAYSVPTVYDDGGTLKLIMGEKENGAATPTGYTGGGPWTPDANVVTGLPTTDDFFRPTTFDDSGTFKLVSATTSSGDNVGYYWNSTSWVINNTIISNMTDGGYGITSIFQDGTMWYSITGDVGGEYYGFKWTEIPTISCLKTEGVLNGTQISTNLTTPYFTWDYYDPDGNAQYSWEIEVGTISGAHNMWESGVLSGSDTSDVYAGAALSRGITYYVQVRANDSFQNGSWNISTFKFNSLPVLPNVSIHPPAPTIISNLTSNNGTATDADGDAVTIAHHWYNNGTRVSALTNKTWVYYFGNTTADEQWKVGMIPNDGYENGTEVFSSSVTIGSGNIAPSWTSLTSNQSTKKYGYDVKFMSDGASDADGDHYIMEIGSELGLNDICNSTNVADGSVANCTISINWTSGSRTFYGRLNDTVDISAEKTLVITCDTTPPVVNTSSINISTILQGASVLISADIGVLNGTIDNTTTLVTIRNPDGVSTNYTLNNATGNATYSYIFTPPSAGDWLVTNIYASDDVGNTVNEVISYLITVGSVGGAPTGGGGGGAITIVELGNLSLSPDRRDTFILYTAIRGNQTAQYKYVANRNITSCHLEPNSDAVCEIVDGYVIYVTLTVNESVEGYYGVLTVTDEWEYKADAELIVRIIKLTSSLPFFNIDVAQLGDGLIQFLEVFFEIHNNVIVGIRTWLVGGIVLGFVGMIFLAYRS